MPEPGLGRRHHQPGRRWDRLAAVLLAACLAALPAAAGEAPVRTDMRIGNGGEPQTLDPHRYNLRLEETILNDLFVGLTTFDTSGTIVPGTAASWSVSEDGLTWTFQLRRDGQWSDGRPLTAADFVYAFRRLLNPHTAASLAHFMYPIRGAAEVNAGTAPLASLGVRAAGDHELVVELAQPFPFFAERLIYPTGYPVPRHVVEAAGDGWTKPAVMVSNGAFTLHDWRPQAVVELRRNPRFFDVGRVALERVSYFPTSDANAAYNRYRAGELDAIGDFPAGEIGWLNANMREHVRLTPLVSIMYLVYNTTAPPFDDARIRTALSLAIDRQLITERVLKSDERANAGLVPALVPDYQSALAPPAARPARLERARRLLEEAGYTADTPLSVTLRYISGSESKAVQLAIAAMWKDLGVATTLHHADLKTHFADLRQGNFQVAQAGWFGENNAQHYLDLLVSDTGDVNYGRFSHPPYDALMRRAYAEPDMAERLAFLARAEAVGLAQHPVTPLYSVTTRALVRPRITGWIANPRNVHGARYLAWR